MKGFRIRSAQDFWTGLAFTAFGALTVALSQGYALGSAARMGPGYFPTILGAMLVAIGLAVLVKSLLAPAEDSVRLEAWLLLRVVLAVAAFAVLLHPLGLVLTAVCVVLIAAWAGHEFRLLEALANAIVLAALSYVLFIRGLNQTMPVWPWFLAP